MYTGEGCLECRDAVQMPLSSLTHRQTTARGHMVQSVLTCAATGLLMQTAAHSLPILHCCIVGRGASLHNHITVSPRVLPGVGNSFRPPQLAGGRPAGEQWVLGHIHLSPEHRAPAHRQPRR